MRKQTRSNSTNVLTTMSPTTDRRLSTASESSIEPLELSSSNKTGSTEANNSTLTMKSHSSCSNPESDHNNESDEPDAGYHEEDQKIVRRENLRQMVDNLLTEKAKKYLSSNNNNSINNNFYKNNNNNIDDTTTTTTTPTTNSQDLTNGDDVQPTADTKYVCPICDIISTTQHDFTEHIRSHNNNQQSHDDASQQNFTCRICSKNLSSASSLDRHVLVHTGERPFTCKYCYLKFTTNGNMHRHMRTHKQQSSTSPTNISTSTTSNNDREHYESDGASTDSIGSTGSVNLSGNTNNNNNNNSLSTTNYNEHNDIMKSGSDEGSRHKIEGKRKSTDDELTNFRRKMKTMNNNHIVNLSTVQKFCCPVCVRNDFPNMLSLENHMDREHPSIQAKCRHCEVVFKSHKALNGHRCGNSNRNQNTMQGFKDLTFVDFSSEKFPYIAKSVCEQSIRTPITSQKFECPKCYRAFPCTSAVTIHVQDCGSFGEGSPQDYSISRKRQLSETSEEDDRRNDFFANLDLQNKFSYNNSIATDFSSTPSSSDCKSSYSTSPMKAGFIKTEFNNMSPLQRESHHENSKDLADIQSILNCTSSSGGFLRQLDKPMMFDKDSSFSSSGGGKYEEEAQDAFTSEFRKMKLRGEFPCRLCTAVFPNLRALKGHNRIHLSAAGPGPYRCNMCPYSINDKAAVVRHMRTHNGDRPYECAICNYAFTTKANCERHLRNRHGKTTRDEVKRAIIYHPSEDSSCEDPMKKLQMFTSPEFNRENEPPPRDRSTPVSHLRDILCPEMSLAKIQVKSLEKLNKQSFDDSLSNDPTETHHERPIDLSMDALDLTKKELIQPPNAHHNHNDDDGEEQNEEEGEEEESQHQEEDNDDDEDDEQEPQMPNLDFAMFEKNQQLLLAQQQFLSEALPKLDPAQYFQLTQFYRSFGFPTPGFPMHPLFFQNPLLAAAMNDQKNFLPKETSPAPPQMSGGSLLVNPFATLQRSPSIEPQQKPPPTAQPQHQAGSDGPQLPTSIPASVIPKQELQMKPSMPPSSMQSSSSPFGQLTNRMSFPMGGQGPKPQPQPQHMNNGPVKMVIKNGVLMPKQKQRRYRTERPFACEHCSARFTLRSNMERHIKQQHPQYWAQRQRGSQTLMRRNSGISSPSPSPMMSNSALPPPPTMPNSPYPVISDQVKYAILAQQLKSRDNPMSFQTTNSQNQNNHMMNHNNSYMNNSNNGGAMNLKHEIDDDEDDEDDGEEEDQLVIDEEFHAEDLTRSLNPSPMMPHQPQITDERSMVAKKIADNILEQAIKNSSNNNGNQSETKKLSPNFDAEGMHSIAESYRNQFKNGLNCREEGDLVSVSKLVDNATNLMSFGNYFNRPIEPPPRELSDEEGLVASGSASESNNSGTDEAGNPSTMQQKKKSAYSLAPNRVACPYCQRMFPWSSSLRRHILTHTGQKPFKCSHCPLLFTTKSNCDRHLLRKHGNVESAMSLQVPIDEMPDPKIEPVATATASAAAQAMAAAQLLNMHSPPPAPVSTPSMMPSNQNHSQISIPVFRTEISPTNLSSHTSPTNPISNSELPYKCHLCDGSFAERVQCLEHMKLTHIQEFTLLMTKVTLESDMAALEAIQSQQSGSPDDEEGGAENRGKYPDYANRKVICAFCLRRFWSTEDLRRHMRTHSGERPFQCDICFRKFTLKHSMLRHRKKHTNNNNNQLSHNQVHSGSASDLSDDEQNVTAPTPAQVPVTVSQSPVNMHRFMKIPDLINKELFWRMAEAEHLEKLKREILERTLNRRNLSDGDGQQPHSLEGLRQHFDASDLIGNLLGISDQGSLNRLMHSSADEAAKLLGVEK